VTVDDFRQSLTATMPPGRTHTRPYRTVVGRQARLESCVRIRLAGRRTQAWIHAYRHRKEGDQGNEQLSAFEVAKKKEQHDTRIVADEGTKRWRDLKDSLKRHVEEINDGLVESLLSYSENANGNEFTLRHELDDRTVQITFKPASALVSYQGKIGKRAFHARVGGDALEYGWENITRCDGVKLLRKIRSEDGEPPMTFSTKEMSEIIIRCIVVEPVPED
jgi:hypothetical protein